MRLCQKCFTTLEDNVMFCPECGVSVESVPAGETSDAMVYPDIARANLLRMRGSTEDAEKVCLGILRRFPNNATAHILLGDIHYEAGNYQQAEQWFEMALDLAEENASLRNKIHRTRTAIQRQESERASAGLEVKGGSKTPAILMGIGAIALLLIVAGAYLYGANRTRKAIAAGEEFSQPISIGGEAPKVSPAPDPNSSPTTTTGPIVSMTSGESALLTATREKMGSMGSRILGVAIDPRSKSASITVSADSAGTLESDRIECARIAKVALESEQGVDSVTVRLIDSAKPEFVYIGTVVRSALAGATGEEGSAEWAKSLVSNEFPAAPAEPPVPTSGG